MRRLMVALARSASLRLREGERERTGYKEQNKVHKYHKQEDELRQILSAKEPTVDEVVAALRDCYDPEIPVNIVDLGLIYDVKVKEGSVLVKMTLTTPGCPAHVFISENVKWRLEQLEGVKSAEVEVVWDPPWTPERLSDDAKRMLGLIA